MSEKVSFFFFFFFSFSFLLSHHPSFPLPPSPATLIRWLKRERNENINMKTITTDGIDISSIGLDGVDGGMMFTTWDFAGNIKIEINQDIYFKHPKIKLTLNKTNKPTNRPR